MKNWMMILTYLKKKIQGNKFHKFHLLTIGISFDFNSHEGETK